MNLIKRAMLICLAAVIAAMRLSVLCFADDVAAIDVERCGSITFYINDPETDAPINSGTFAIYRLAGLTDKNGGYEFELTRDFAAGQFDLTNTASARFAISAADYVNRNNPPFYAVSGLQGGVLKFENLPAGLYLAVNTVAPIGYYQMNPFAFSIPTVEDGKLIYDVVAEPKPEPMKPQFWTPPPPPPPPPEYPPDEPDIPDDPDDPDDPDKPDDPDDPDDPDKPRTPDDPDEPTDSDEVLVHDPDGSPQTGDKEQLYMWFLGMALSASAAVAAVIFYIVRKKDSRKGEKE